MSIHSTPSRGHSKNGDRLSNSTGKPVVLNAVAGVIAFQEAGETANGVNQIIFMG